MTKCASDPFTDKLTATGQAQAELLGNHLKNIELANAFSSDYLRAEETAQGILGQIENFSVSNLKYDQRLRERVGI